MVVAVLAASFIFQVWLPSRFSLDEAVPASDSVQTLARSILVEKLLGEIGHPPSGDEGWYKSLLGKKIKVSRLDIADRLNFYTIVLLNVSFSAESIDTFSHMIKPDARQFRDALTTFEKSSKFHSLSKQQQFLITSFKNKANEIFLTGDV